MWSKNVNNDFLLWLKISTIHFSYPLMESTDGIIDHKHYYVGKFFYENCNFYEVEEKKSNKD